VHVIPAFRYPAFAIRQQALARSTIQAAFDTVDALLRGARPRQMRGPAETTDRHKHRRATLGLTQAAS
jgi:hypothetical protein